MDGAANNLTAVVNMEVEVGSYKIEGVGGGGVVLEAIGLLIQEADMVGITLVDSCNGFN